MKHHRFKIVLVLLLSQTVLATVWCQEWTFANERNGIKIYTRQESGKTIKSYRAVTRIHAPVEKVFSLIEDVHHTEWWDPGLSQIKVLLYEKNKRARYYLVYNLPWPVKNRDLCVETTTTIDIQTGEYRLTALPVSGLIPEVKHLVRIKNYYQTWIVRPQGKDVSLIEFEGYLDPAGNIPEWILNMMVVDFPVNCINRLRVQLEKKEM